MWVEETGISLKDSSLRGRGFTLIELLTVLMLLSILIGVVAPQGYKVLERSKAHLARLEEASFKKRAVFQTFLLDRECDVTPAGDSMALICGDLKIMSQPMPYDFDSFHITRKGFLLEKKL